MTEKKKHIHDILQIYDPQDNVKLPNARFDQIIIKVKRKSQSKKIRVTIEIIGCFEEGKFKNYYSKNNENITEYTDKIDISLR